MDDFRAETAKVQREHEAFIVPETFYCCSKLMEGKKTDGGMSVYKVGTI